MLNFLFAIQAILDRFFAVRLLVSSNEFDVELKPHCSPMKAVSKSEFLTKPGVRFMR